MNMFRLRSVVLLALGLLALVACGDLDLSWGWPDNIGGSGGGGNAVAQVGGPEYTVSFVCGSNPLGSTDRILPGEYATLVTIFNQTNSTQTVSLKVALSFPPGDMETGDISGFLNKNISTGRAIEIDCDNIRNDIFTSSISTTSISGYLLIQATTQVDVTATYTAGTVDTVSTMNVQKISPR
jgi:hypothetical protein